MAGSSSEGSAGAGGNPQLAKMMQRVRECGGGDSASLFQDLKKNPQLLSAFLKEKSARPPVRDASSSSTPSFADVSFSPEMPPSLFHMFTFYQFSSSLTFFFSLLLSFS